MKFTDWLANIFPKSQPRRPNFSALDVSAWVEVLENRVLLSGQSVLAGIFATMPGTPLDDFEVQFQLTDGAGAFQEMGVFVFDADGTVDGLSPGDEGFNDAVLNRRMTLFESGDAVGSMETLTLTGADQVGMYFCQDQAPQLTAERIDVRMTGEDTFRVGFEENASIWPSTSNGRQFDDASIDVTLGEPVSFAPPTLDPIDDVTIPEEELFELTVQAENPEGDNSDLRYRLDTAPDGATIDEMTGEFSWTPSETQGPGRFDIVITAFNSTRPAAAVSQQFIVDVTEVNVAPVIGPITPGEVIQNEELRIQITATDADRPIIPVDRFTFSLVNNTIDGASIDPDSGLFTWTPTESQGPGTFSFDVRVVDNGNPQLDDTETFTVRVDPAQP